MKTSKQFPEDFMHYSPMFKALGLEVTDAKSNDATGYGEIYFTGEKSNYCCEISMDNCINEEADITIIVEDLQDGSKSFEMNYMKMHLPNFNLLNGFYSEFSKLLIKNGVIIPKLVPALESYVDFEIAKLLKRVGFNNQCYAYFDKDGKWFQSVNNYYGDLPGNFHCPTIELATRWIDVNAGIILTAEPVNEYVSETWKTTDRWAYQIQFVGSSQRVNCGSFANKELAMKSGLFDSLTNFEKYKKVANEAKVN